jgi:hypothetical protein
VLPEGTTPLNTVKELIGGAKLGFSLKKPKN